MRVEDLTSPERSVFEAFCRDEEADLRVGQVRRDDPMRGGSWGPSRILRAEALAWMLSSGTEAGGQEPGRRPALRVVGASIRGVLNLDYTNIQHPLRLTGCHINEPMRLYGARTRHIAIVSCALTHFYAANLVVEGTLRISDCSVRGLIRISGAHVSALLVLDGTKIVASPDPRPGITNAATTEVAVDADRIYVGGNVWMREGFSAQGTVRLTGSRVEGDILMSGARLITPLGCSLAAARIQVNGAIEGHDLTSVGEFVLDGAAVAGAAEFTRSKFRNPTRRAFAAANLTAAMGLELKDVLVEGGIGLCDVSANRLDLSDASVSAPNATALDLQRARTRQLDMRLKSALIGSVDLRHASADIVAWGERDLWPPEIKLDGMTYVRLVEPLPAARQLELLLRDDRGYVPQPFEQLARIYRDLGHEDEARVILLAKERLRHARLRWYGRVWGTVQEITVGYGYRPLRAGFWLLALLIIGTVTFTVEPARRTAAAGDQSFSPVIFTLDHLMPVFQFGQGSEFAPTPGTQWIAYGLTAAGWLLATAVATGVARLVNRV